MTVEFDEDVSILQPLPSEIKVPETGFEGWFYRKMPGGFYFKKALLIGIVVAIFAASLGFFALGRYNLKMNDLKSFNERAESTNI